MIFIRIISGLDKSHIGAQSIDSSSNFNPLFWEELKQLLGPIFGPIFEPIIVPVLDALSVEQYRLFVLDTIVWTFVIISGLVFLAYEIPIILSMFSSPKSQETRRRTSTTTVQATSARREVRSRTSRRIPRSQIAPVQKVRREIENIDIKAKMRLQGDIYTLDIQIINGADFPMKMTFVELYLPEGIDTAIGTLRMQRLGEIEIGDSKSCTFQLISRGGDIEDLVGYVEFMSDAYEAGRIPIPRLVKKKKEQ